MQYRNNNNNVEILQTVFDRNTGKSILSTNSVMNEE